MSIKNFGIKKVQNYLQDSAYYIPDYQREYSWTEDQLEDFWQDLENTISSDRRHFFGQIVIHDDNGKQYIIDGQQRTTTAVIFLAVLRDMFGKYLEINKELGDTIDDIRIIYIGRYKPTKDELRLHLGMTDQDYFREHIQQGHPSNEGKTPSQKRIYKAYAFFEKKLDEALSAINNDQNSCVEKLTKYYDTFLQNFDLMAVTTDDINEAFIIFETLNTRGKDLETADLLKNYVFMQAGSNIESVKNKWQSMLETLDQKDDATKYIRYYWNATHSFTREKSLYKEISQSIKPSKCAEFVSTLNNLADLYNGLSAPYDNKFFDNNEIKEILVNLSVMKASTFYPIVFAMQIANYSEKDILQILKAIEVLIFRNIIVAGQTANKYEIVFSRVAVRITQDKISPDEVIKELISVTNDTETFKRDLIGLEVRTVTIAKYILREIEDYGHGEIMVSKDNKAINLEHIMPKNNTQWKVNDDIHNKYLYRLANQTLLLEEYNKSISNKVFETKKSMYAKSKIEMTKKLCDYEKWDIESINHREQELIDTILKRWSLVK